MQTISEKPLAAMRQSEIVLPTWMKQLNQKQSDAVTYGCATSDGWHSGPLLVVAGAGTGKTATLCHRVAWLLAHGVKPDRLALLTFSRRAASEMVRRSGELVAQAMGAADTVGQSRLNLPWTGTFHSVAARLLREHASLLGLNQSFSIIDRADATDLLDWLRERQQLASKSNRFPSASTCLNIYSDRVKQW